MCVRYWCSLPPRSVELLHTATLIHDDVIDETKQRRGVPSLNAIFDNRISVLVGDYVLSTALIRSIQTGDLRIVGIISNLGRDLSEGEIKQLETAEESILDENCYLQEEDGYLAFRLHGDWGHFIGRLCGGDRSLP